MKLTSRDRKMMVIALPVVLVVAFWFLLLAPKRDEASKLGDQLTTSEQARDDAKSGAAQLEGQKNTYAKDYATVVRLGKAIPTTPDVPSLLVQMKDVAAKSKVDFESITVTASDPAAAPPAAAPPAAPGGATAATPSAGAPSTAGSGSSSGSTAGTSPGASSSASPPAAAPGGATAQTAPGKTAESAGTAAQSADQSAATSGSQSADSAGGAAAGAPATGSTNGADSALTKVPISLEFEGRFFALADFLHRIKRFVYVDKGAVAVHGRLLTIDSLNLTPSGGGTMKAAVEATVYLTPLSQGPTAGATPAGPAPTEQASSAAPTTPAAG